MKKIVKLTEADIKRIVKKVINEENKSLVNEALTSKDGTYKLYAKSGWLKDNKGNTMCIKVDATWPIWYFRTRCYKCMEKQRRFSSHPTKRK